MTTKTLIDGTSYTKATHHKGNDLQCWWEVSYKIDGVRIMRDKEGRVVSRNSKPLFNCDNLIFKDAEFFRTDWNTSVSIVRSQTHKQTFQNDVYELRNSVLDKRLLIAYLEDPSNARLQSHMRSALELGYEGIVARKLDGTKWIKLVPELTADIKIIGFEMSDKRKGFIKNFKTAFGNVSATSFDIEQLQEIADDGAATYLNKMMEVGYREKTCSGKLRFAKFKRWRDDKDEESL